MDTTEMGQYASKMCLSHPSIHSIIIQSADWDMASFGNRKGHACWMREA